MNQEQTNSRLRIFALNSNKPLAEKIAAEVGVPLGKADIKKFADGEIQINIEESIRGCEVYIIQSVSNPVNTTLMELMIMIDAVRRASASSINVVMPYYGYARQDRKARSREPITAKLIATLLEMDQITRVITLDLHADQVQGFFNVPVDHLLAAPLLANYFYSHDVLNNLVVVSPDHSGVSRARKFAELLQAPIAIIDNRDVSGKDEIPEYVIGDVDGKVAVLIDDIIDTGVRMDISAQALKNNGATDIYACATHAVFSGNAVERLQNSQLSKVIVTDSIAIPADQQFEKLVELSIGQLFGKAIQRIHLNEPVDSLFISPDKPNVKL